MTANYTTVPKSANNTGLDGFSGKIMFMDTQREKEIGLGPKWNFEPLGEGECLANFAFESTYSVTPNETIIFNIDIRHIL